jgi:hypothetical protein
MGFSLRSFGAVTALTLISICAHAGSITLSGAHNIDIGTVEGFGGTLTYFVMNNSTHDVTISGLGFALTGPVRPDPTDNALFHFIVQAAGDCAIGTTITAGNECLLSLAYTTPNSTEMESDTLDQGFNAIRVLVGVTDGSSDVAPGLVIVDDLPPLPPLPPIVQVNPTADILFEGGSGTLTYAIVNDSDTAATIAALLLSTTALFGDDIVTPGALSGCNVGTLIAAHGTCTVTLPFTSSEGIEQGQDGLTSLTLTATLSNGVSGSGTGAVDTLDTPEPSAVFLFGAGLVALAAFAHFHAPRRRRSRTSWPM